MSLFVTLDQAKHQVGIAIEDTTRDEDLADTLEAAEAIILDWLNANPAMRDITAAWTPDTIPLQAQWAIRYQFGELWRFRGDDLEGPPRWTPNEAEGADNLSPVVIGLLRGLRPPVLA